MRANVPSVVFTFILLGFIASCTSKQAKEGNNSQLLGAGFGINSATVLVQNVDSARNYYARMLGFTMPLPEKFEKGIYEGTLGVTVTFPDLSSIELLSVKNTGLVAAKYPFITSFFDPVQRLAPVFTGHLFG